MSLPSATQPPNRKAQSAGETLVDMIPATPGWWALVRFADRVSAVPVPFWVVMEDDRHEYTRITAVDVTGEGWQGGQAVIADEDLIEYRFDPRPETFERYIEAMAS